MFEPIANDLIILKTTYNLPLCLIGDFNSRTGNMDDTFTIEQSVINNCGLGDVAQELFDIPIENDASMTLAKRHNKDNIVNNNGQLFIDFCKASNMKIVNGRLGADKGIGEITFTSTRGSSVIDYCIVSPNLIPHIQDFEVDTLDRNLSDCHSPIVLTLKTNHIIDQF